MKEEEDASKIETWRVLGHARYVDVMIYISVISNLITNCKLHHHQSRAKSIHSAHQTSALCLNKKE